MIYEKNIRPRDIVYPLAKETINKEDIDALCDWLKTYPRLTKGELTWDVEEVWSKYIGTDYAVFSNSGSSANLLMVAAAINTGRIPNKKIVVPSVGWVTTIAPAIQLGLTPIMVGADKKTFGIDLDHLEKICKTDRPDAVIYVQVLGVPHYRARLLELKEKYGFCLLEDACAALGASYDDGQMVGSIGDMSSFSFYFGHQLSTIEGGMVNTNDKELYDMLLMLRSHGWGKDLDEESYQKKVEAHGIDDFHKPFAFFVPGFNLRATDLQAFIGLRQMKKAQWVSKMRNENHILYAEKLKGVVEFQDWGPHHPVSISFGALAKNKEHRGLHPFWVDLYGEFNDEVSNRIHSCGFFLPNYPEMSKEDIDFICGVVRGPR